MKNITRWLRNILIFFFTSTILAVVILKYIPVYVTPLMLIRAVEQMMDGKEPVINHRWVPLEDISRHLPQAVMASEDNLFLKHKGFDLEQIQKAQIAINQHKPVEYIGNAYIEENASLAAESEVDTIYNAMTPDEIRRAIDRNRKLMKEAAKHLEFLKAEEYKQEIVRLEALLTC